MAATDDALDREEVVRLLNRILEQELAGVVRYTHYSLLVFGFNRIPIVAWLREQAAESLLHAQAAPTGHVRHRCRPSHGQGRPSCAESQSRAQAATLSIIRARAHRKISPGDAAAVVSRASTARGAGEV